ncbi:hypothetical protein FQN52_009488 [Onygenales sp. PD_12]|nr:hypothetical protein FQN52_009488 [Onygenales sp. PD_12]
MALPEPHDPNLLTLPNELLHQILEHIPTASLLPLAPLCRRLHNLIARLVYFRLYAAIPKLGSTRVKLECYHPAFKPIGQYLKCVYLYSDSFCNPNDFEKGDTDVPQPHDSPPSPEPAETFLASLKSSYSHFKPCSPRAPWINTNMSLITATFPPQEVIDSLPGGEIPVQGSIWLDENELFTQLITSLWVMSPPHKTCVVEGVVRLWRGWLGEEDSNGSHSVLEGGNGGDGSTKAKVAHPWDDKSVVWVHGGRDAGLRVRARRKMRFGEEEFEEEEDGENYMYGSARYDIEIEEVLIRTITLLLTIEKTCTQECFT